MIVELITDIFDLLLSEGRCTSNVCNLPLREAGLEPKLLPVSFINKNIIHCPLLFDLSTRNAFRTRRQEGRTQPRQSLPSLYRRNQTVNHSSYSALAEAAVKRNSVSYKFKNYKDGKPITIQCKLYLYKDVESLEDAFPCKGDKKWSITITQKSIKIT